MSCGEQIDFSLYLEKELSEESRRELSEFSKKNPKIKEELFNKAKNSMMSTIYNENQSYDYIKGVIDTLNYIKKLFK